MANDSKLDFGEIMAPQHREGFWGMFTLWDPSQLRSGRKIPDGDSK